jgi:hypothetical protein
MRRILHTEEPKQDVTWMVCPVPAHTGISMSSSSYTLSRQSPLLVSPVLESAVVQGRVGGKCVHIRQLANTCGTTDHGKVVLESMLHVNRSNAVEFVDAGSFQSWVACTEAWQISKRHAFRKWVKVCVFTTAKFQDVLSGTRSVYTPEYVGSVRNAMQNVPTLSYATFHRLTHSRHETATNSTRELEFPSCNSSYCVTSKHSCRIAECHLLGCGAVSIFLEPLQRPTG